MKPRIPRIPILATVSFLLLITIITLWSRSPRHADVLMFFTPAGHLAGVASDRKGLLLAATEIQFGSEMGLSADATSASADEFTSIHKLLFDPSNEKWHLLGFRSAGGTIGQWNWRFNALIVPYWAVLIPLAVLPLTGFRRGFVRRRRTRRGQCLGCGYDLRRSPDRCPECGRPVSAGTSASATPDSPRRLTWGGAFSWLVMGALVAATITALTRGRHAAIAAATSPPELTLLDRRIGQVDIERVPLARALDAMAQSAHAHVAIDWPAADADRETARTPCSVHLDGVRLGAAVRLMTRLPDDSGCILWPSRAGSSEFWADARFIHISPESAVPPVVRSYPVAGLLRQMEADLRHEEAASQPPPASSTRSQHGVSNALFVPTRGSFQSPPAREALVQLVEDLVVTADWTDNGGTLGALAVVGDRLWVCQTQEGHAAVREMLAMLVSPAGDAPAAGQHSHADLEQRIAELKLDSTTLEGAIDAVRQATHANIIVYWNDLQPLGLRRDTPIKLHLWDVTLDRALGAILTTAGGEYPGMRAVQDDVILIASPDRLLNGGVTIRLYDIRDLIDKYLAERRSPLSATRPAPAQGNLDGVQADIGDPPTYSEMVEMFARLIEDVVDTDSWKDNGGSVGALREIGGRLVITQTPAAHRQITALLRTLRTGGSKDGTPLPGGDQKAAH